MRGRLSVALVNVVSMTLAAYMSREREVSYRAVGSSAWLARYLSRFSVSHSGTGTSRVWFRFILS